MSKSACLRWGTGSEQCVLSEEHLGPCRTLHSENPMLDVTAQWMLLAIFAKSPDDAYALARMAAHLSGRTR